MHAGQGANPEQLSESGEPDACLVCLEGIGKILGRFTLKPNAYLVTPQLLH